MLLELYKNYLQDQRSEEKPKPRPNPSYPRTQDKTSTHVLTWRSQPKELFNLAVTRGWSCSAGTIEIVLHQTPTTALDPKDRCKCGKCGARRRTWCFWKVIFPLFCTVPNQMFQTIFQTMLQNKLIFQTMFQTIFQTNITKPITPYPIPLSTVRNQEVEKLLNHPCCWFIHLPQQSNLPIFRGLKKVLSRFKSLEV